MALGSIPLAAVYVITITFPKLEIATKPLKTRGAIVLPPEDKVPKVLSKNSGAMSNLGLRKAFPSTGTTMNYTNVGFECSATKLNHKYLRMQY